MVKKTSNQWPGVSKTRILEPSLRQDVSRNPVVLTFLSLFECWDYFFFHSHDRVKLTVSLLVGSLLRMGCILSSPELCKGWRHTKCIDAEGCNKKEKAVYHAMDRLFANAEGDVMGSIKAAVVGLGLGQHFVRALAGHPDVGRLVLVDPDADRAEMVHREHDEVDAIYEMIEVMLEKERPDAVCVVTPDHLHRPHSTACFEAGAHVLQTKPLATNLEDARAILAVAKATGKKVMVAHERRFRPETLGGRLLMSATICLYLRLSASIPAYTRRACPVVFLYGGHACG